VAVYYRVEIATPTTNTRSAKTWTFTAESNVVQSINITLQKEGKRISTAIVQIADPKSAGVYWPLTNSLPDPAFADVPVRIYLAKDGEGQSAAKLVFDGKASSYQMGYPGVSHTTIVAHDRSLDLRLRAVYRTFKNKTSVQVAQAIAQDQSNGGEAAHDQDEQNARFIDAQSQNRQRHPADAGQRLQSQEQWAEESIELEEAPHEQAEDCAQRDADGESFQQSDPADEDRFHQRAAPPGRQRPHMLPGLQNHSRPMRGDRLAEAGMDVHEPQQGIEHVAWRGKQPRLPADHPICRLP